MLAGLAAMAVPIGGPAMAQAGQQAGSRGPGTQPFTALFGTPVRGRIQLDRADYDVGNTTLSWGLSNTWVKGAKGGSRIHGSARTLLSLQNSHDCVFEDIVFEVTAQTRTMSSYEAVVRSAHALLRNHRFVRCRFIVRDANQNALKLIAERGNARIESMHFEDCTIDGAGRMGLELQNHAHDGVERLIDFRWEGGAVRDTGLISGDGMGISLSGMGTDHRVNTLFENNRYAALENVGSSHSTFSGRSRLQTRGDVAPISFTNVWIMRSNTIADFVCLDRASGSCRIWNQLGLTMRNNRLVVAKGMDFRGIANLRSSNDLYDSSGPFVLSVADYASFKRATRGNVWSGLTLDTRSAAPGLSSPAIRFAGNGTAENVLDNAKIWARPGSAGQARGKSISNIQGARGNALKGSYTINGK